MKALAIGVILLLAYTSAVAYPQSSGYVITVQTDKPYYYAGGRVYISGRFTYNDWGQQNVFINIYVARANYNGYSRTDSDGNYSSSFTLGTNAQLGTYVVSVTALTAPTCTNQTTFRVIDTFVVPVTPLGTLAAIMTMISILGVYVTLRKRKP